MVVFARDLAGPLAVERDSDPREVVGAKVFREESASAFLEMSDVEFDLVTEEEIPGPVVALLLVEEDGIRGGFGAREVREDSSDAEPFPVLFERAHEFLEVLLDEPNPLESGVDF